MNKKEVDEAERLAKSIRSQWIKKIGYVPKDVEDWLSYERRIIKLEKKRLSEPHHQIKDLLWKIGIHN